MLYVISELLLDHNLFPIKCKQRYNIWKSAAKKEMCDNSKIKINVITVHTVLSVMGSDMCDKHYNFRLIGDAYELGSNTHFC